MKAMFTASRNVLNLDKLIKEVDSRMADLHLRVSSTQLALAVEMDTKIDKMMKMMEKMAAGAHDKEDPADMDPHVLAEIAKQAGMEAGKAMQDELGAMSAKMMTKMDEIADAVKGKIAHDKAPMFPCCSILT
jgi:predicted DsbA family dithiol-disulfide isomerase